MGNDGIGLTASAGGITNTYANNKKAIIKNTGDNVKVELDDTNDNNETITITNSTGTGNDAIALTASAGGITNTFANNQEYVIKNSNEDLSIKMGNDTTDDANKKITILNTNGTDSAAIDLKASAGGITQEFNGTTGLKIKGFHNFQEVIYKTESVSITMNTSGNTTTENNFFPENIVPLALTIKVTTTINNDSFITKVGTNNDDNAFNSISDLINGQLEELNDKLSFSAGGIPWYSSSTQNLVLTTNSIPPQGVVQATLFYMDLSGFTGI